MIEYLSGNRIQGLSEPTFIDNLSTDKGWTTSNSSFLAYDGSSNELDWLVNQSVSQDNEIYLSVGTLNDEKFVARFQYDVDTATVNDGNLIELFIGMSDSTGVGSQDFIGMYHKYRSTLDQWGAIDDNSTSPLTNINGTDAGNITGNTGTYYCEIIRLSSTTYKITMYTNSDYSGIEWQTSTLTVDAGVTGLQYFKIMTNNNSISSGGNVLSGSVKNIAIANGVTDYDTKPTNVQAGSRYEETDTRKIYRFDAETTTTFTSDFTSTSNWTSTDSRFAINTSENAIIADHDNVTTNLQIGHELSSALSNTAWVIDLDVKVTDVTAGGSCWTHIGMYDVDTTVNDSTNKDFLGMIFIAESATMHIGLIDADNSLEGTLAPTAGTDDEIADDAQFYLRMTRTASNKLKLERFTTSARTTLVSTAQTRTLSGNPQGLDWFKITNRDSGLSGELNLKIENVKIWDGYTSVSLDRWLERGVSS